MLLLIIDHMKKNKLYFIASIGLLILAIFIFGHYITSHSYLINRLKSTSLLVVASLIFIYIIWFGSLVLILKYSLKLCNISLKFKDNLLLNAYSTIINFFVPGQGGPAVRGAYLYKRFKLRIRVYIFLTLIYYLIYGLLNSIIAFAPSSMWWLLIPIILGALIVGRYGGRKYLSKFKIVSNELKLNTRLVLPLVAATLLQITTMLIINLIELHTVKSGASFKQTLIYTGVENLTIFVALTPGAIGIREGFLIFSQKLHHISTANIISANIVDRSMFILVLLILLVFVILSHAKSRLFQTKTNS